MVNSTNNYLYSTSHFPHTPFPPFHASAAAFRGWQPSKTGSGSNVQSLTKAGLYERRWMWYLETVSMSGANEAFKLLPVPAFPLGVTELENGINFAIFSQDATSVVLCLYLTDEGRWAEWNGKYRDDLRRFVKGDCCMKGSFATRIAGSADLYRVNNRKPYHSINFIIAHDGFTFIMRKVEKMATMDAMITLVGTVDSKEKQQIQILIKTNEKLPFGINDIPVLENCAKLTALMFPCGEESRDCHKVKRTSCTLFGNNNSYGHDTAINHFQWTKLEEKKGDHFRFFAEAIKFRKRYNIFKREHFLGQEDVTWHEDNWSNSESKLLAFTLHGDNGGSIYVAFNAHDYFVETAIPSPPPNRCWLRVVDTNLPSPNDFVSEGVAGIGSTYNVAPFSSILLEAK